ncbi:hypothetical protein NDU88_004443 [Pleurodeles waltl]|uniref:Uncharacterized protein n=1 Tax=Pleurodeles waltl TaxID=8319 RepID=A0AAV7PD03_PLEWA|nr:hypothetical protein NDU88_004443 [Pleurodeles waltl]
MLERRRSRRGRAENQGISNSPPSKEERSGAPWKVKQQPWAPEAIHISAMEALGADSETRGPRPRTSYIDFCKGGIGGGRHRLVNVGLLAVLHVALNLMSWWDGGGK